MRRNGGRNSALFWVDGEESFGLLVSHHRIFLAVEDKDGRGSGVEVEEGREAAGLFQGNWCG